MTWSQAANPPVRPLMTRCQGADPATAKRDRRAASPPPVTLDRHVATWLDTRSRFWSGNSICRTDYSQKPCKVWTDNRPRHPLPGATSRCKCALFEARGHTAENRCVPGSSPGLAINESPAYIHTVYRCISHLLVEYLGLCSRCARTEPPGFHGVANARRLLRPLPASRPCAGSWRHSCRE
jgi:hypothetical protein